MAVGTEIHKTRRQFIMRLTGAAVAAVALASRQVIAQTEDTYATSPEKPQSEEPEGFLGGPVKAVQDFNNRKHPGFINNFSDEEISNVVKIQSGWGRSLLGVCVRYILHSGIVSLLALGADRKLEEIGGRFKDTGQLLGLFAKACQALGKSDIMWPVLFVAWPVASFFGKIPFPLTFESTAEAVVTIGTAAAFAVNRFIKTNRNAQASQSFDSDGDW